MTVRKTHGQTDWQIDRQTHRETANGIYIFFKHDTPHVTTSHQHAWSVPWIVLLKPIHSLTTWMMTACCPSIYLRYIALVSAMDCASQAYPKPDHMNKNRTMSKWRNTTQRFPLQISPSSHAVVMALDSSQSQKCDTEVASDGSLCETIQAIPYPHFANASESEVSEVGSVGILSSKFMETMQEFGRLRNLLTCLRLLSRKCLTYLKWKTSKMKVTVRSITRFKFDVWKNKIRLNWKND